MMSTFSTGSPAANDKIALRDTFVEMLFALAVGQVAVHAFDVVEAIGDYSEPKHWEQALPALVHLFLALSLISASWIGWMKSPSPARDDVPESVIDSGYWKLMLDVILVVLYFIVVQTVEVAQEVKAAATGSAAIISAVNVSPSAIPESISLCVVFFVYFVWDLTHDVFSKDCIKTGITPTCKVRFKLAIVCGAASLLSFVLAVSVCLVCSLASSHGMGAKTTTIMGDLSLLALVYFFRASKSFEYHFAQRLGVADFPATNPRKNESVEKRWTCWLFLFYVMPLLYLVWKIW